MEKGLRLLVSLRYFDFDLVFSSALMEKGLRHRRAVKERGDQVFSSALMEKGLRPDTPRKLVEVIRFLERPDGEGIKTSGCELSTPP